EAFGIGVGKLLFPMLARVCGVVDARLLARTSGHQKGFVSRECGNAAKVQGRGAQNLCRSPMVAAIGRAEIGSVRSRGPRDLSRDSAHSAKVFRCTGPLCLLSEATCSEEGNQQVPHEEIVA